MPKRFSKFEHNGLPYSAVSACRDGNFVFLNSSKVLSLSCGIGRLFSSMSELLCFCGAWISQNRHREFVAAIVITPNTCLEVRRSGRGCFALRSKPLFRHEREHSDHGPAQNQKRGVDLVLQQDKQDANGNGGRFDAENRPFRHGEAAG